MTAGHPFSKIRGDKSRPVRNAIATRQPVRLAVRFAERVGGGFVSRFIWPLVVCAGVACGAAASVTGAEAEASNFLKDVQIGEAGEKMRIALICQSPCDVRRAGDKFVIAGVEASLDIDLSSRSNLAQAIVIDPSGGGSQLTIQLSGQTAGVLVRSEVKNCVAGDRPAACIDLLFDAKSSGAGKLSSQEGADALPATPSKKQSIPTIDIKAPSLRTDAEETPQPSSAPIQLRNSASSAVSATPISATKVSTTQVAAPALKEPPVRRAPDRVAAAVDDLEDAPATLAPATFAIVKPAPVVKDSAEQAPDAVAQPVAQPVVQPLAQPALRDRADGGAMVLADRAPLERFSPPSDFPTGTSNTPSTTPGDEAPAHIAVVTPLHEEAPLPLTPQGQDRIELGRAALANESQAGFSTQVLQILGKSLDVGRCQGAKARLQNDAWALDAMIDSAFCEAADGNLEEADGALTRLLAYTPDNYEALVGRALIASQAGEKSVARKYFQDALNALPPIEESNRIVAAMDQL